MDPLCSQLREIKNRMHRFHDELKSPERSYSSVQITSSPSSKIDISRGESHSSESYGEGITSDRYKYSSKTDGTNTKKRAHLISEISEENVGNVPEKRCDRASQSNETCSKRVKIIKKFLFSSDYDESDEHSSPSTKIKAKSNESTSKHVARAAECSSCSCSNESDSSSHSNGSSSDIYSDYEEPVFRRCKHGTFTRCPICKPSPMNIKCRKKPHYVVHSDSDSSDSSMYQCSSSTFGATLPRISPMTLKRLIRLQRRYVSPFRSCVGSRRSSPAPFIRRYTAKYYRNKFETQKKIEKEIERVKNEKKDREEKGLRNKYERTMRRLTKFEKIAANARINEILNEYHSRANRSRAMVHADSTSDSSSSFDRLKLSTSKRHSSVNSFSKYEGQLRSISRRLEKAGHKVRDIIDSATSINGKHKRSTGKSKSCHYKHYLFSSNE